MQARVTPLPIILWAFIAACSAFLVASLVGCKSLSIQELATPARIEAVTALGTYIGAKELNNSGSRAKVEAALRGLQAMQAAGKRDMVAIAATLSAAGIKWIDTPEGTLAFGIASSIFTDKYGPETILGSQYADAVINGSVRGLTLALAGHKLGTPDGTSPQGMLASQAAATRKK